MHKYYKDIESKHEVQFVVKSGSTFMKLINAIIGTFWWDYNRFMSGFFTTISHTIYCPVCIDLSIEPSLNTKAVIAHELEHAKQFRDYGLIVCSLLYLFPVSLFLIVFPILLLLGLADIISLWWLFVSLILFIPIAPWRFRFEMEACAAQAVFLSKYDMSKTLSQHTIQVARDFDTWSYWMSGNMQSKVYAITEYLKKRI